MSLQPPLRRFKLKDVTLKSMGELTTAPSPGEDMPRLPEDMMVSVETTFFWPIENADISTEEDLDQLLRVMYDCPEHEFYFFLQKDASKTDVVDSAMNVRGDINVVQTDLRFCRHPKGGHGNFVRIRSDDPDFEWMSEAAKTQEYVRFTMRLSERKRREMEVKQHLAAHADSNSSPLLLQPNLNGVGIDLPKAWARFRKWVRGERD
jgi:hypothetical protein